MNDFELLPDDPRLTAYALGELEGDERAEVEAGGDGAAADAAGATGAAGAGASGCATGAGADGAGAAGAGRAPAGFASGLRGAAGWAAPAG
mgnify:CR=1 FL=1